MSEVGSEVVSCRDGLRGVLEPERVSVGGGTSRVVRLDDGRRVVVPASLLKAHAGGGYELPMGLAEIERLAGGGCEVVVPVTEEHAEVATRRVETGR
ncbi:MAG: hypothetical protein LC745_12310, partial [Planctomycetia bacterium]|nr:hypothetical protein [Planctomycetia bacterium]